MLLIAHNKNQKILFANNKGASECRAHKSIAERPRGECRAHWFSCRRCARVGGVQSTIQPQCQRHISACRVLFGCDASSTSASAAHHSAAMPVAPKSRSATAICLTSCVVHHFQVAELQIAARMPPDASGTQKAQSDPDLLDKRCCTPLPSRRATNRSSNAP